MCSGILGLAADPNSPLVRQSAGHDRRAVPDNDGRRKTCGQNLLVTCAKIAFGSDSVIAINRIRKSRPARCSLSMRQPASMPVRAS